MTDTPSPEEQFRTAYKHLIDEVGEGDALDILDALRNDAHAAATFGQPLFEEDETDPDDHEFDTDERRMVERDGDVLVDVETGDNAYQEVRGAVEVIAIEDGQLVLGGDTYDAKNHIKAVDYQYYEFDGDRKVWLVDETVIETLHRKLNGAGFLFVDARGEAVEADEGPSPSERLRAILDDVSEGDRIRVEYAQKNGEGMNDKEGVVRETRLPEEEEFVDTPTLRFERDDGQRMYVKPDVEYDPTLALYTAMSHAPFVGDVETVEVVEGEA